MISPSLNDIFSKSIIFAKELRHEYLTIEHVFYLLLNSEHGEKIIYACGGDVESMKKSLKEYIQSNIDTLPKDIEIDPYESVALLRVIDNMIQHIQSAQQQKANIGDLIVAIFEEKNTYSYMLLSQYQISKLDVIELISHNNLEVQDTKDDETFLDKYSINLLEKAKEGKIDPVIGRD